MAHVNEIVSFGKHRTVGSHANEVLTPRYLHTVLGGIRDDASNGVRVEVVTQLASGAFHLNFLDGMSSVYTNVTNIVVRLSPATSQVGRLPGPPASDVRCVSAHLPCPTRLRLTPSAYLGGFAGRPCGNDDRHLTACLRCLSARTTMPPLAATARPTTSPQWPSCWNSCAR